MILVLVLSRSGKLGLFQDSMKLSFERGRIQRLCVALSLAALVAMFLCDQFQLSRFWAVPAGLFVALQLQKRNMI